MGLDVYVGPLSRYYAREWETIVQQAGRESGIDVQIVRPGGDEEPPPIEEVYEAVMAWRRGLAAALDGVVATPFDWSEAPEDPYSTDKIDWDGHAGVLLLAAHEEFPQMTLPGTAPRGVERTALWDLVLDRYGNRNGGLGRRLARLLGRTPEPRPVSPYAHIYFPQLWLPVDFEPTFESVDLGNRKMLFGSVPRLRAQLERLNENTLRGDEAKLKQWRWDGTPDDHSFEATARFGLAAWLALAKDADERRQPMILDW